jgi:hypothetical protein
MLILIAAVILGVFLVSRNPRLERSPGAYVEATKPAVRAYVDGKPVKSYLKED